MTPKPFTFKIEAERQGRWDTIATWQRFGHDEADALSTTIKAARDEYPADVLRVRLQESTRPADGETLTAREAAAILFPPDIDPETAATASFRSGTEVCELLAAHFGLEPGDYAGLLSTGATSDLYEPGTVLACPHCGTTTLNAWYLEPTRWPGVTVIAGEDGSPELTGFDVAPSIGEGGTLDDFSCPECSQVGIKLAALVPAA